MNVLDSELVLGQLRAQGYESTDDREGADIVIYNTCSVREHAEQKVWSRLGEMRNWKDERPGLVIGVIGGAIGAQTSPTCSLDVYNNWVCNNDLNYVLFIIYILVWVGIGWGVDILWRRFVKKNNASTP